MHKYTKEFDKWNIRKKNLEKSTNLEPLFVEREIWWMSVGVNVGYEEDGKNINYTRPVLIIKKIQ